jgi:hypothetical protein
MECLPSGPSTLRNCAPFGRSIGHHQAEKRGVIGNVDTALRLESNSFIRGYLCGQADTVKHDLEARIKTQAIQQQVRLKGQDKV